MESLNERHSIHKPRFCEGSIMRHVIRMAGTGAIGLMAVFIVDFLNLFYIALLKNPNFTAAIGFAGVIGYLQVSICIGLSIGVVVVTARLIGSQNYEMAGRVATSFLVVMTLIMLLIGIGIAIFVTPILQLLGARGEVLNHARIFTLIVSPGIFILALGMGFSGLLRAVGDARRSMNVTLLAALVTAILDPIFILGLHLNLEGAAISTVISRVTGAFLGFYGLRAYKLIKKPVWNCVFSDAQYVFKIALPAILTNLATPVGSAFVIHTMARFGTNAISAQAAIDRTIPVAFAFIFALTGSVGPIISQNFGSGQRERVRETLSTSLKLVLLCVICAWGVFILGQNWVIRFFSLSGDGVVLMRLFCNWVILGNLFLGILFVSNTSFNNLGYPLLSTAFNWGRATLGTIPFVWIGSSYGPEGVLIGQSLGMIPFSIIAVFVAFFAINHVKMIVVLPTNNSTSPN